MRRLFSLTAALMAFALPAFAPKASAQDRTDEAAAPIPVTMTVDASKTVAPLPPIWRFFGADEPNYATMKDGRKLMAHLGELRPGQVYFRAHNLLSTGDGTPAFKWGSTNAYTEDAQGNPVYDWTVVDHIIEAYLARGVKPYLQIGFTPQAMSSAPEGTPYQHTWRPGFAYDLIATGWIWPPKDYEKWEELVYQWTKHNVERYGPEEVATWYFQVWNEPNLSFYWAGTPEDFYRLHDHAIAGVRRALPQARVGGPDVAGSGGAFMDGFLKHVVSGTNYATGEVGTPTDFLSFHAKGAPRFTDGHVRMSMIEQLKAIDTGFGKVAAVPELKTRPIVIGENDPEGCAACPGPQNAYRNGTLYASYTAASYARIWELAGRHKVNLDGALTWAFTFEDQPWFAGYRQLATNGIDLPVINTFRLFSQLGPDQLAATSSAQVPLNDVMASGIRGPADVGVLATRTKDNRLAILVWHYHDDDVSGPVAEVALRVGGLKGKSVRVTQWRVDGDHGNAFTAWQQMGSPQSPDQKQYAVLETASKMVPEIWPEAVKVAKGTADFTFTVPRQGVSLMIVE